MKYFAKGIIALTVSLLVTAVSAVASLIITLFGIQPGDNRQETFFGAIFLEARNTSDGGIGIEMGLGNPTPLIIFLGASTLFILAIIIAYGYLVSYRSNLLRDASK